jgi:hypothetical protein
MVVTFSHLVLRLDAASRLGARPVVLHLMHRARLLLGIGRRALLDRPPVGGPFFNMAADRGAAPINWHGPFNPTCHALDLPLFTPGDIRPVWEVNRLGTLPALAAGGDWSAAERLLSDWAAHNPPFRGPAWACGQECALRALTLAISVEAPPSPAMRALLDAHARRIEATPIYALAQDNNHAVSEAAGLLACGLLLGDARRERSGAAALIRATRRLIAPCGAFAQPSARYHRLLLDTLAVTAQLWRRHRGPEADRALRPRAAAATAWLARIMDPETGRLPRLGPEDPSCFADLAGAGPDDARASVARAQAVFGAAPVETGAWVSDGWRGWQVGRARAILRTGVPSRFRPPHADFLHLDLWVGAQNLLRDGGTGSYNPPREPAWQGIDLAAARAHNLITFDDAEPMPRVTRFLFARWSRRRLTTDGAETRVTSGMTHSRAVALGSDQISITDTIGGPFSHATLRWRLAPGAWRLLDDGAECDGVRIVVSADAPLRLRLVEGVESPAYGTLATVPVLEAVVEAPATRFRTLVDFSALPLPVEAAIGRTADKNLALEMLMPDLSDTR